MWIKQTTFNINISSEDIALIFLKMCVTDDGFKDRPHSGKLFFVNFKFEISYQCNQLSLNSGLVQNSEITIFKRFFWCAPFLVFVEFITTLLLLFYVFFFFGPEACGILDPQPGIEPSVPALEGEVLPTGLQAKSWK